jgi:hypothetical protein
MICAKSFGAVLELADLDLSICQEAATIATTAPELEIFVPEIVAHICELMSDYQKEWRGFDRWYRIMMDYAVLGSEENPVPVDG